MEQPTRRQFLAGSAALAAGLAGCTAGRRPPATPIERTQADAQEAADAPGETTYASVYEATIDSVVFVGDERAGGSGFVHNGHVVTNEHVVDEIADVNVRFERGEWREAAVRGADPYSDLAVLATDVPTYATSLPFVEQVPPVGTEVLALGSPFGLASSLSQGVISGRNRSLPNPETGFSIPNTVQTDAGLDPGNSGGPLVTMDGEVTGIAVAGAGTAVGFAVSPLLARRVLPELAETGSYDHPYLGILLVEVTPTIAEANDLAEPTGIMVVELAADGPTGQTLEPADGETVVDGRPVPTGGDVLVELAGEPIESENDLATTLALSLTPGDRVVAVVIRDGEEREIDVPIGTRPSREERG